MLIQRHAPVVDQVATALRHRICEGVYPPGGRLPSENQLALELGVSRTTIRTVMAKFASEGLILRRQGDGTYVNERIGEVTAQYGGLRDFSSLIEANGHQPAIQTLSLERRSATLEEAEALEIDDGEAVVSMVRLFNADDLPAILTTNILPLTLIHEDFGQLNGDQPLYQILQMSSNEQVAYVISDVEAAGVDEKLANTLRKTDNQPLLRLREMFFNKEHKPLFSGLSYFDFTIVNLRLVRAWS